MASKTKKHRCVSCRKLFDEQDIEYAPDPYAEDVHNDSTKVWECAGCRNDSAMDI